MPYATTPTIGVDLTSVSDTALFAVGTTVSLSDGGEAMYVQALSELSTYAACLIYETGKAQMATTTLSASGKRIGFAQTSLPSAYYGWVQISGAKVLVNLAANAAPNVPLYTTATAGVLDDATVSGGLVLGAIATNTISNATAVTLLIARGACIATGATPN